MKLRILPFLIVTLISASVFSQETQDVDIDVLVGKLRNLSILFIDTDAEKISQRQQEKIELADQILEHPDMEESHRLFAVITRLQSLGIQFHNLYRDQQQDDDLNETYRKAIEEGLEDEDQRIMIEATTAQAGFQSGLFILNPNKDVAQTAAKALHQLGELGPKDPLVQTARRLLLEQLWKSDEPELVFKALDKIDGKLAQIVLDEIEGSTDQDTAEFLWARHFARFGDLVAQLRLADMYETGKGTRVNHSQAARWYTKLARLGNRSAQVKLGDFFLEGKGYSQDAKAAVEKYQAAAAAGSRIAQFKLGQCYRNGTGVEENEADWRKWIRSSASNASSTDVQAVYTAIDFKSAAESYQLFYESLVEQNPDDFYYLNNLAYSLLIMDVKNPERALELINRAIELTTDDFSGIANFLDTKATALMQLGKTKEAAEIFESVLDKLDDKKPILESLIECYDKLDDAEKADEFRKQLENLKGSDAQ